jgi:O-antigen ligase
MVAVAVLATGSRASVVTIGGMWAVLILATPTMARRSRLLAGAVGAALVALSGVVIDLSRLGGVHRLAESGSVANEDIRVRLWRQAWEQWLASPTLGVGPGGFHGEADLVAHNTYLSMLAETGFIGLLAFLSLPGFVVVRLVRLRSTEKGDSALIAGLAGLAVQMVALNLQNVRFVWVFLAIACGAVFASQDEKRHASNRMKTRHSDRQVATGGSI